MTTTKIHAKTTQKKLSEQVENELYLKGYSFLFNFSDYQYYKSKAKNTFNKVQSIVEMFIQDNSNSNSDYNGYIY